MIPDRRLATDPYAYVGAFLAPDDQENVLLEDYELGGTDLNDPSDGLKVKTWTASYNPATGEISLSAPGSVTTVVLTIMGVSELSLAFDQNMQPVIAFVENGAAKFYWWDTDIPGFTTTTLPAGSLTPRVCMDDKRDMETAANDVILCYVTGDGKLVALHQRDRYSTVDVLMDPFVDPYGNPALLKRIGMNANNRLQGKGTVGVIT